MKNVGLTKEENINNAKNIISELNVIATFSNYSDSNGVSVYFKDENNNIVRVSNHSTGNTRMQNELQLSFDDRAMNFITKKDVIISRKQMNEMNVKRFYNN